MQRITVITGLRQEGKSAELTDIFVNQETPGGMRKVFISCVSNINNVINSEVRQKVLIEEQANENSKCVIVDDEDDLINCIKEHVSKADTVFYIDDPEIIFKDFYNTILNLSNTYPNADCEFSFDVVFTTCRIKE